MKKTIFVFLLMIAFMSTLTHSQINTFKLKNDEPGSFKINMQPFKLTKKADAPVFFYLAAIINPMLVIEDKKVFFGLTKEVSFGKFPFGRFAFEYSYIFRSYNTSHLRFSYNYDIILEAGNFIGFVATPGAGYFTDTKNKGWFLHGSFGAIIPVSDHFAFNPYLRYRHTFINDKLKSDINDISLGTGFMFWY